MNQVTTLAHSANQHERTLTTMLASEPILYPKAILALHIAIMLTGIVTLFGVTIATLAGALWAISIALTVFLAHTSSTQLLLMGIILYFSYRAIKYVRGLPR